MPHSPALKGRIIDGIWCDPLNHEKIARVSDHWATDRVLVRGEDDADEAWTAMMDWMPHVTVLEEQCVRTLHRTPCGKFFVHRDRITIRHGDDREHEDDKLTLMTRDQAWHWAQAEGVILIVPDFTRWVSRRKR